MDGTNLLNRSCASRTPRKSRSRQVDKNCDLDKAVELAHFVSAAVRVAEALPKGSTVEC